MTDFERYGSLIGEWGVTMTQSRVFAFGLLFFTTTVFAGFQVSVSESPKNNLALTLKAIQSAKKSLFLNMYEFTSDAIADALIQKIEEGIRVEILEEGQPVGKMSKQGVAIKDSLVAAMESRSHFNTNRFYLMTSEANNKGIRRFRFDHAKYLVVDEKDVVVGSENYSPTGHPAEGAKGTRGWETLIKDPWIAKSFLEMFRSDSSLKHEDVLQLVQAGRQGLVPGMGMISDFGKIQSFVPEFSADDLPANMEVDFIERLNSPDTSLDGLVTFIRSAKKTLDLQLMSFSMKWGNTGKLSPLFKEVADAARRKVSVRVLLNDETVFANGGGNGDEEERATSKTNETTVDAFNEIARKERLDLEAAIADVKAMGVKYIHNKGMLADDNRVLISSINWNQNSVMNNRETAVGITGTEINSHYKELFERDWESSKKN